jgi:hypothetical protein
LGREGYVSDQYRGLGGTITYRKYVTMQDEQETLVEGVLDEYCRARCLAPQAMGGVPRDFVYRLLDLWVKNV